MDLRTSTLPLFIQINNMKKSYVAYFILFLTTYSCSMFEEKIVVIDNQSDYKIDSIEIPKNHGVSVLLSNEPIAPNQSQELRIKVNKLKIRNKEGFFDVAVYVDGNRFDGIWGFHDLGYLTEGVDTIVMRNDGLYFFDNMITPK